ncbi:MAG: stage V sporulation protein AA [Anaerotignum sp.]|nr:stage V sporulation protein AA [Anaerotignum sp.]
MDIYIKPVEKVQMVQKREVLLRDVAEVFVSGQTKGEAEKLVVFQIPGERKKTYLLSVMDLICALNQKYPDATVSNVGEMDILVEYLPKAEKKTKVWTVVKVAFVSVVLFIGAATTIMCFHTDTQLPLVFQNIYYIFFGENREMPALLSVPYSIGLGLGIIIFFNHFSKVSLTEDPTPIEIEMTTYEKETNASVIDFLGRRKGGGEK